MKTLLRFVAVLVVLAFVVTTLAVVLLRPAATLGLKAALYKDVLVRERIYERMPALVGEALRAGAEARARAARDGDTAQQDGVRAWTDALRQLDSEDWTTLLGSALPASLLRMEVERGLDAAEQFLHHGIATGPAAISLVEVKSRLAGAPMTEAYAAMLARKPPCTAAQWDASLGLPVSCRPSPDKMAEALENFGRVTSAMAGELPDSIELLQGWERLAGPEGDFSQIERTRVVIRRTEFLGRWSPAAPVAMALLIALLAVRSFRGLLYWWGVPCLITGALGTLVAGGFVGVGIAMMSGAATADLPPDTPIALVQAILDVVSAFLRALMQPALITSVVLCGAGVLAVLLAVVLRPKAVPPSMPRG